MTDHFVPSVAETTPPPGSRLEPDAIGAAAAGSNANCFSTVTDSTGPNARMIRPIAGRGLSTSPFSYSAKQTCRGKAPF